MAYSRVLRWLLGVSSGWLWPLGEVEGGGICEDASETATVNKLSQTYMDRPWKTDNLFSVVVLDTYQPQNNEGLRVVLSFRFPYVSYGSLCKLPGSTFGVIPVSFNFLPFAFPNLSSIRGVQNQAKRKSKAEEAEAKDLMLASKWDWEQLYHFWDIWKLSNQLWLKNTSQILLPDLDLYLFILSRSHHFPLIEGPEWDALFENINLRSVFVFV